MTDQSTPTRPPTVPGGLTDSPGAEDLRTDGDGLDGDLRTRLERALTERWNADDPGATTLDDTNDADTAATPDPASPSTSAAPDAAPVEDGAGVGGDAGEGAAPVDPASSSDPGTPPPDDFSLDEYATQYFGTRLSRDQARNLFATLNGLQNLTPQQREEVDRVLAGGQAGQYPATTGQPITPGQPPQSYQPSTPATPGLPPRPDDEYEAQIYDRYIAPLAQTQQQIQQQIAATTAAQLERERAEAAATIERASSEWRARNAGLTDGEYDALVERISRSGVFPALINSLGSVASATHAALDQFFWADESLRSRAIANLASGRSAGDSTPDPTSPIAQQQQADDAQRQARAASVAGGGGSTTPRDTPPAPKDAAGRKAAMIQELAQQGDFG